MILASIYNNNEYQLEKHNLRRQWEKKNNYLMREMSECPAARVTMLISVRGLGSVEKYV